MSRPKIKKSEITLLLLSGACLAGYAGYRVLTPGAAHLQVGTGGIEIPGTHVRITPVGGVGDGGPSLALLSELPPERRDPFKPLPASGEPGPVLPEQAAPPAPAPAATPLPPAAVVVQPPFEPPFRPAPAPEPQVPTTLIGTAVGQEVIALFEFGPLLVEKREGEHVGPYRIAEIDHGRVRLVNRKGLEAWLLSGQTLGERSGGTSAPPMAPPAALPMAMPSPAPAAPVAVPAAAPPPAPAPHDNGPRALPAGAPLAGVPEADAPFFVARAEKFDSPIPLVRGAVRPD
jgi:hypothetical protein